MNFDEMHQAVTDAREQIKLADAVATKMAELLVGRLRHVNSIYALKSLKRELAKFNIHTGRWMK